MSNDPIDTEDEVVDWQDDHCGYDGEDAMTTSNKLTEDELNAIEARANAATPPPWDAALGSGEHVCTMIFNEQPEYQSIWIADLMPDYFLDAEKAGRCRLPKVGAGGHVPNLDFIMAAREDVPRLIAEIRRLNSALDQVDDATKRIDAGLDRVQAGELAIIEAYFQRVCARAEATIERTHQIAGAHYAAMQVELNLLRQNRPEHE